MRRAVKILVVAAILTVLSVSGVSADGASFCGTGSYTFYPTHDANHKITYHGASGTYAEIWWYENSVLRGYVYNGSPSYMYTPINNPITVRLPGGCVYIEDV